MNTKIKVLVVLSVDESQKVEFQNALPNGDFNYIPVENLTKNCVSEYSIIIGNIPVDYLTNASKLKWLQLNNAGTEGYTEKGVLQENAILTNATGAYGGIISEHMLGMLLMIQKQFPLYYNNQKQHIWKKEASATTIEGSTTLVVGMGDIGGTFAKKMKALGSYTIGIRRRHHQKPDYIDELYSIEELDQHLDRADIVALCLPGFDETYHLITKDRLLRMKKGAILINVGRGTAINTTDLIEVVKEGHLKGVCLDVTDPEPLPREHELWDCPGVFITPHVSGPFRQKEALDKIIQISIENLRRYSRGQKLMNIIDFETGYCIGQ
ncbi:D-2-hydroxyacid dehydrogenase [Anaeromicropila herbilytica]|uniref:Dehydrogenase n=1 Tax=Anaeromicropila herbilytica TaxID=2785025 RepID=A0A7R7ENV8_9FIRM|nr:D-2-hydroxyacid dehydrogenase [Anaeromicropila herbilytica]BCN32248.1 dehydrogenase [Anaeromicropila herbilytica]